MSSWLWPAPQDVPSITRFGALVPGALEQGNYFQFFTAPLLHAGVIHLLINMLALWNLSGLFEPLFGRCAYLVVYAASGLVGCLCTNYSQGLNPSLGSSGAICGVLGAGLGYLLVCRRELPGLLQRQVFVPLLINSVVILLIGVIVPFIDHLAHAGGFFAGLFVSLGFALGRRRLFDHGLRLLAVLSAATVLLGFVFIYRAGSAEIPLDVRTFSTEGQPWGHFSFEYPSTLGSPMVLRSPGRERNEEFLLRQGILNMQPGITILRLPEPDPAVQALQKAHDFRKARVSMNKQETIRQLEEREPWSGRVGRRAVCKLVFTYEVPELQGRRWLEFVVVFDSPEEVIVLRCQQFEGRRAEATVRLIDETLRFD